MNVQAEARAVPRTVAELLRRARLGAGVEVEECAGLLGVSPEEYLAYESGAKDISLPQLELLSRHFDVPVTYFWHEPQAEHQEVASLPPQMFLAVRRRMIGVLLRQARLAASQSLSECARVLGVDSETIASYEYGKEDIPFSHLRRLADFLHVPLTYFTDESLLSHSEKERQMLELLEQMPADVREFVLKPANVLYLRLAMLLSELSVDTLRRLGEGLLDITL